MVTGNLSLSTLGLVLGVVAAGCGGRTSDTDAQAGVGGELSGHGSGGEGIDGVGTGGLATGGSGGEHLDIDPGGDQLWEEWLEELRLHTPPEEDRLERPSTYVSPIPSAGSGWRESTTPVCSRLRNSELRLWADEHGVALLAQARSCFVLDGHGTSCAPYGTELWFNDGTGWTWLFGLLDGKDLHLTGMTDGEVLLGGPGVLAVGRDGDVRGPWLNDVGFVHGLTGDSSGAYALMSAHAGATGSEQAFMYDGTSWTEFGDLGKKLPEYAFRDRLTAIDGALYVHGMNALYRAVGGADFEEVPDVPLGDYVGVSGTSSEDLWLVNSKNVLLHYDGESWTEVEKLTSPFRQFLKVEGRVYFISDFEFGRATPDGIEVVHELESAFFSALAASSAQEIFVAVTDPELDDFACGPQQLFVYDGEEFHSF